MKEAIGGFKSGTACFQTDPSRSIRFTEWIAHVFEIRDLPPDLAPENLVDHIRWALEARRTYLECLKAVFSTRGQALPRWVYTILKLGRYAVASMALLQLASEFPFLFNPMLVEPAIAPSKVQFTISKEEMPLTSVLRRLISSHEVDDYISRLARVWSVGDAEAHFREACTLSLSVHAEMQLLNFYDHNPGRRPAFRFIGVSKKSCFLCQRFLVSHPQVFSVSSCHQKLYLPWRPPPAANASIYRQYKSITNDLSKDMEAAAKQELQNRLGLRRPVPPDSTAGVSLSGLTGHNLARGTQDESTMMKMVAMSGEYMASETLCATSSLRPIAVVDLSSPDEELSQFSFNASPVGDSFSIAEMVFHVMRPGETHRQDIIAIRDIMDPHSGNPSWIRLVDVLRDDSGIGFKDGEFLMVNGRIRIGNERQLLACLQYLRNATVLNSEVFVYARNHSRPMSPDR